ncbi:acyl-CoA dehydrogenase family protein [Pseudodonghicola flavimaris]|uniref:Acyl-CoA dehydrogenase family protein n=1 Tax=Pseudodonghicola flavimaris TaxID=3050036 RepID=A0ABT7EUL0_9RHOB|nr:acyl-CoA dehydrogenase family protein [Pseudodonghicola flavimaris]MDK3016046.1 acyl-CoA dehydrogenase family protein [Pseudodonghicola flavimaris]
MQLTHEHEELRRSLRRWIDTEVNPNTAEWEAAGIFPAHKVFRSLGDLGLLGISKSVAFGGMGLGFSYAAVAAETLGAVQPGGVALAIGVQTDMCTPALEKHGSDALREAFLRPAISGERVGCIGVSEPGAGSDVAAIRTSARKDGSDYIINGAKMWITNGTQADFCCLLANTGDGPVHRNKSLIVVPMDSKGVEVTRKIDKIGMRCSDTAQLYFDEVRVPQSNCIGEENMGFLYQMEQFQYERLWGSLNTVGVLQRAIDCTIAYTRERQAFGKAILDNQWVAFKLAEMQCELSALQALSWQGVAEIEAGQDATRTATMAKLLAGQLSRRIADGCLQFWGGMGYSEDSEISQIFRDTRLTSIGGGADEVMLQILTKFMGTHPQG